MKEMNEPAQLEEALVVSDQHPIFVFKHSTRCPISAAAYRVVSRYETKPGAPDFYIVSVIESRSVSNEVAVTLGVEHKSPQLILVHNREAVWSSSHYGIAEDAIDQALKRLRS